MLYSYKCDLCDYVFEESHTVDDIKVPYKQPCPNCDNVGGVRRYIGKAPTIGYNSSGQMKNTDNFKDRLREIKKNVPTEEAKDNISKHI